MTNKLGIKELHVTVDGKEIVKGVNLDVNLNEVTVLMGPNGSGKSTFANVLLGNPKFKVERGSIHFNGTDITNMKPSERAKLGLFLSFQYPAEISGVTIANFLRTALNARRDNKISVAEFKDILNEKLKTLNLDDKFVNRYLNEGFSGGEKKKCEMLQLAVLNPKLAVLDEIDSGLDIPSLQLIGESIDRMNKTQKMGILIITHYERILKYLKPDRVHVMIDGKIVKSGNHELVDMIEKQGYDWLKTGKDLIGIS